MKRSRALPTVALAGLIAVILDIISISRDVTAVMIHIVLIGLPIALVVRRFSKEQLAES
jgi:hypothetical protein